MGSLSNVARLVELIGDRLDRDGAPVFVGLDGRSGVGKSTLASAVAASLADAADPVDVVVIGGDDFYAGGTAARWDRRTAEEKADGVIDWRRERAVLEGLRSWGTATWHPFDWEADGWDLDPPPFTADAVTVELGAVVILEGAYSCRPELHDILDLTVLLDAPEDVRRAQLLAREGEGYRSAWEERWSEAEEHYFHRTMGPERFDLVLEVTGPERSAPG